MPVVNEGGRCVGIITEADLVLRDSQADLHLPHYIDLFGGVVFLEPLKRFEDRLRKAFASKERHDDARSDHDRPGCRAREAGARSPRAATTGCPSSSTAGWSGW